MRVGGLFSGIGGLELGLERAGMEIVWHAENDPYCSRVLAKHWPNIPNLGDVSTIDWSAVERVDLVCGGFPCQPVSVAGRRAGQADTRWLWPEMERAIRDLRPCLVVVENVPGLRSRGLGRVLGALAALGYDAEWTRIYASWFGAPHRRSRLFVVAYPSSEQLRIESWGSERARGKDPLFLTRDRAARIVAGRLSGFWGAQPGVRRVDDGVPYRMERHRALGNAVVPQVAEWVGRQIVEAA